MATPTGTFSTVPGSPVTTVNGTDGGDVLGGVNIEKNLRINAKGSNDILTLASKKGGTLNSISAYGNAGADTITTGSTITGSMIQGGGNGDNIVIANPTTDVTVRGGSDNDLINGVNGGTKIILNGNKGFDNIMVGGTFVNSSIFGGDNDDTIEIQAGILDNTDILGDKGNDLITDNGRALNINFRNGSAIYGNDGTDFINFSATTTTIVAQGGNGDDSIIGGSGVDTLTGGADNDYIDGNAGDDNLSGSAGNDFFNTTAAEFTAGETINGGSGTDTVSFETNGATNINDGVFTNKSDLEVLRAGGGGYTLNLGAAARAATNNLTVFGNTGADYLNAASLGASVTMNGSIGADKLRGSNQADRLENSATAADTLIGAVGSDVIVMTDIGGGAESDVVSYDAANQGGNVSTITTDAALTLGDSITGMTLTGAGDDFNIEDAARNGSAEAAAAKNKNAVNLTNNAFSVIDNATLNFVAGTTKASQVGTAIGSVIGADGDRSFVAIATGAGVWNVFQVVLNGANGGAAALAGNDTISHIAAVTSAETAANFAAAVTFGEIA